MAYQTIFKRYEIKYMLDHSEKEYMLEIMQPYMQLDNYGRTTIRNIYFDTENYRLIRRSLEKPAYKEKLRIRSYKRAAPDDQVFVELKKKYRDVVYKRRLFIAEEQAMSSFETGRPLPNPLADRRRNRILSPVLPHVVSRGIPLIREGSLLPA